MFCLFDAMPTYTWHKNIEINYPCTAEIKQHFTLSVRSKSPDNSTH